MCSVIMMNLQYLSLTSSQVGVKRENTLPKLQKCSLPVHPIYLCAIVQYSEHFVIGFFGTCHIFGHICDNLHGTLYDTIIYTSKII
jgi:hypothetical protein